MATRVTSSGESFPHTPKRRPRKTFMPMIAQALTGSYREEHLFELKLAYEAWQFTLGQVAKVDGQIALQLGRMKGDRALPPLKRLRSNHP